MNEITRMKSLDPASLQNLNDIVLPAPVAWWPLAGGWYFLSGIVLIALAWLTYRLLKCWMNNRYRRAALRQLRLLSEQINSAEERDANLRQIPILLKRAALCAYPRSQVAALTGKDWVIFLNSRVKNPIFTQSTADTLNQVSYVAGELSVVDAQAATALINASRQWLNQHQHLDYSQDRGVV